jgi:Transcriptional Coactivator p15 (PC4)
MREPHTSGPAAAATAGRPEDRPEATQTGAEDRTAIGTAQGVVIGEIPKNAREKLRVSFAEFRGYRFLDLRIYAIYPDGDRPTKTGLTVRPAQIPSLRAMLQLAEESARREGMIP